MDRKSSFSQLFPSWSCFSLFAPAGSFIVPACPNFVSAHPCLVPGHVWQVAKMCLKLNHSTNAHWLRCKRQNISDWALYLSSPSKSRRSPDHYCIIHLCWQQVQWKVCLIPFLKVVQVPKGVSATISNLPRGLPILVKFWNHPFCHTFLFWFQVPPIK